MKKTRKDAMKVVLEAITIGKKVPGWQNDSDYLRYNAKIEAVIEPKKKSNPMNWKNWRFLVRGDDGEGCIGSFFPRLDCFFKREYLKEAFRIFFNKGS